MVGPSPKRYRDAFGGLCPHDETAVLPDRSKLPSRTIACAPETKTREQRICRLEAFETAFDCDGRQMALASCVSQQECP
jgi:hypothetical protein